MRRFIIWLLPALIVTSCDTQMGSFPDYPISPDEMGILFQNDDHFSGSHWNDPHVLKEDDQFIMYASSDRNSDGVVKLYRFTSSDGLVWDIGNNGDPVFERASNPAWDSHGTETPSVVHYGGQYHLFYTGYDVPYDYTDTGDPDNPFDDDNAPKHFGIGHATSTDGITWVRTGSDPVIQAADPYELPDNTFYQYVVGEPGAVVFNGKIHLYFTAVGAASEVDTTWQTIGLITYDGTGWSSPQRVLVPDLELYPRNEGIQYAGYSTPNATVIDGHMHLFVDVAENDPWRQALIHHAVSSDGIDNWNQDQGPMIQSSDYHWTEGEVRSPAALMVGEDLYLYFAGHYFPDGNPNLCIGLNVYRGF